MRKAGPFPLGSEFELTLPLKEALQLSLKGVVIHTKDVLGELWGLLPIMAIEFREISTKHYDTLKNFIENLLAQDILDNA